MASNENPSLLQCTRCHEELDLESKTLPCLHSFCCSCLDRHFEGAPNGDRWCPECHEPVTTLDQLSLSPFLVKSLKRRQLESTDWKCDLCSEDDIESTARNWCQDCQKLHCANCSRIHEKLQKEFHRKHTMSDLGKMGRDERDRVIKVLMTEMCPLHKKAKDLYCEKCNACLCDVCYEKHSADCPECSSPPLSVREEALKQKSQGPTLAKEMDHLEMSLRRLNGNARSYTEELNSECETKCRRLWEDLEEMIENAKQKTNDLCEELKQITAEQVKRWGHLLEENENILKQLEIWRINLHHMLNESQQDADIIYGFQSLRSKLSSRSQKPISPDEKCQLEVTFPNWWQQGLKQLRNQKIGSVSLAVEKLPALQNVVFDKQFELPGSDFSITSMCVSKEDGHIFLCSASDLIIELTEQGEQICECKLLEYSYPYSCSYSPLDICFISPDILVVACREYYRIILLKRRKIAPFLQVKKFLVTERKFRSVCKTHESILACDFNLQIDSLSKHGKTIKTLKTGESNGFCGPLIRADPMTRNFWMTDMDISEIFCFNSKGEKIRSVKKGEEISDFCMNEFGLLYFCNKEGIFSLSPEKNLYNFEKKSAYASTIFILGNKMFVSLWIDGKSFIKIFNLIN